MRNVHTSGLRRMVGDSMTDYVTLPDQEAADAISAYIIEWDEQEPLTWARLGLFCIAIEKRLLWQLVNDPITNAPCHSFNRWVRRCAPRGYSTCYAAKRSCEDLADVPAADLAEIPESNFHTMKLLSTAVRRDPEVLAAAKSLGPDKFLASVMQSHPGQALESRSSLRFNPTSSQKQVIMQAIEMALQTGQAGSKEELLELWAVAWLQEQQPPIVDDDEHTWRVQ